MAEWYIQGFNDDIFEIQGELPDTTNHATCFYVTYIRKYYFKPYKN